MLQYSLSRIAACTNTHAGMVADTPDGLIKFQPSYVHDGASSVSSFAEPSQVHPSSEDPLDFSVYMDEAPLTLLDQSPMEMLHRFFVKLGARYVVVTDSDGLCESSFTDNPRAYGITDSLS